MAELVSWVLVRERSRKQFNAVRRSEINIGNGEFDQTKLTHVALAKTRHPPAKPPPQHAQPIPKVQAICLSSFGAAQSSRCSVTKLIILSQTVLIVAKTAITFCQKDRFPCPSARDVFGSGNGTAIPSNGGAVMSPRAVRMESSRLVKSSRSSSTAVMAKK